jgi:putative flippase GtrA
MQKQSVFMTPQFLVYVSGGVLCAVIDIGLMQILVSNMVDPVVAASAGFIVGLFVNYVFHAKVTFKNVTTPATFFRFMCLVVLNYLITIVLVALAARWLTYPLIGKLCSLPIVALNGFFLGKHWVFKE